ncbi:MAG: hypothetical protein ACR2IK_10460 [Chloroflexota bacterium]
MTERPIAPYVKDCDATEPPNFADRWDTSAWGLLTALEEDQYVGGAVVAFQTPGLDLLEARGDLAVLLTFGCSHCCAAAGSAARSSLRSAGGHSTRVAGN